MQVPPERDQPARFAAGSEPPAAWTGEASARRPLHELGERANHTDYVTAVHPVRRDARYVRFEITSRRSGL
jgi:hypothetical protein